jgi:hypothetical protein
MDRSFSPSVWYFISFTGIAGLFFLCFITRPAFRQLAAFATDAVLKYLVYYTTAFFGLSKWRISASGVLFSLLYVGANGVCMGWGVTAAEELSRQSASMLATNLVLLLPGASIAADILHVSPKTYCRAHSIVGLVALIEGSIHAGRELTAHKWNNNIGTISGTTVRVYKSMIAPCPYALRYSDASG